MTGIELKSNALLLAGLRCAILGVVIELFSNQGMYKKRAMSVTVDLIRLQMLPRSPGVHKRIINIRDEFMGKRLNFIKPQSLARLD